MDGVAISSWKQSLVQAAYFDMIHANSIVKSAVSLSKDRRACLMLSSFGTHLAPYFASK